MYFSYTDIHSTDTLYIYDGPDVTSPLIGAYNNNSVPVLYLMPVNASIYNASGCLTVRFVSDGAVEANGWWASITCEPQCQNVTANLSSVLTSPAPDTGYIAICPGTEITFSGYGTYDQNNYIYNQSDATSTFEWVFGDGTVASGQTVSHTYTEIGGYTITLLITDNLGCKSTNSIDTRVMIAGNPFTTISNPPVICANDTLDLLFGSQYNPNSNIGGDPFHMQMDASLAVTDTTYLPDGTGATYTTSVTFNCFAPGQELHNAWDIVSLCANMEHSFLGDLEIKLICPNGQSIILKEYPGGGGTYLGVPLDYDPSPPGEGWDYCWAPGATYGTMVAESATYSTLPAGDYTPFESFADLVGCPLNGQWSIEVTDNWAIDDGYIFSWELSLNPFISPNNWSYTIPIAQQGWTNGPFIIDDNGNEITVAPTAPGVYEYTYTIVDAVGCVWDTSAFLTVIPAPVVDLGQDVIFCETTSFLNLDAGNPGFDYLWNDGSTGQTLLANASDEYSVTVSNGICNDVDTISIYYGDMSATSAVVDATCNGASNGSINLDVIANSPPLTYAWSNGDNTEDINNVEAGTYTVSITDANGCSLTLLSVIDEPEQVVASVSSDPWICIGEIANLTAAATGGTPGYTYIWSNGQNGSTINVNPNGTTEFSVQAQDLNGCMSNTEEVTVNVYFPISVNVSLNDATICLGDEIVLNAIATGGNGNYTYTLLNSGTTIIPPYSYFPNETNTYTIVASDDCGSPTDQASANVTVYQLPPVSFMPDTINGCQPLTVNFIENSPNLNQTYNWDFGDNDSYNSSTSKNPQHVYDESGIFTVSLTVTSAEGCKNSQVVDDLITVYPKPNAKFLATPEAASIIKPIINFQNLTLGALEYHWYFGDGDSSLNVNPEHMYAAREQSYLVELYVESEYGCKDTVYDEVRIMDEYTFHAPTGFSPDNDGVNDFFYVSGHGISENNFSMKIYDRWGEVIFETTDINEHWDGTANGGSEICKIGVYTWQVVLKDKMGVQHQEYGAVTIIR